MRRYSAFKDADYYRILELEPGSSLEEVKAAYRRMAKLYHPDLGKGNDVVFARLLLAYDRLRKRLEAESRKDRESAIEQAVAKRDHPALLRMLAAQAAPEAQTALLRALGRTGKISIYTHVRRYFQSRDLQVRLAAIHTVGEIGAAQAAGELEALFQKAEPEIRREILLTAIKCRRYTSYGGIIKRARLDDDPGIQEILKEARL